MRVPTRRYDKKPRAKLDPHITIKKFKELKSKLKTLKENIHPKAVEEVKRLALDGDFSENFAYQIAKGKLRGINNSILKIENILKNAEIIDPDKNKDIVQLGNSVTIEKKGKEKTYQILGSAETNPESGIISHTSPLGSALLNKHVGDIIKVKLAKKFVGYKIIKIS